MCAHIQFYGTKWLAVILALKNVKPEKEKLCVEIESLGSKFHSSANPEIVHGCCGAMICIQHCQICQVHVCSLAQESLWEKEQPHGDMEWDPGDTAASGVLPTPALCTSSSQVTQPIQSLGPQPSRVGWVFRFRGGKLRSVLGVWCELTCRFLL